MLTQKEIEEITLKPDLFNQNLDQEYSRIFPLLTEMIKKEYNIKDLNKIIAENNKIIFNLQDIMESDVRKLNDLRKELSLKNIDETNTEMIKANQSKIDRLKTYILRYVNYVYTPTIKKHKSAKNNAISRLEQFFFNVIDTINEKMEKVKNKLPPHYKEFCFDDGLDLYIMVKNNPSDKFLLKYLHFEDLETEYKKIVIQILKTEY